jgi:hypothetical protein
MNSTEITAQIVGFEEKRVKMAAQLDALMAQARDGLPPVAESWIKETLNRQIDRYPAQVQSLGVDRLRALKDRVKALVASLPELAKRKTSIKEDWPHYCISASDPYREKEDAFFLELFREIISNVGPVLVDFGFLEEEFHGSGSSWQRVAQGEVRYSIGFGPEHDVSKIEPVKEYIRIFREYRTLLITINAKQQELAKAKARELFESA